MSSSSARVAAHVMAALLLPACGDGAADGVCSAQPDFASCAPPEASDNASGICLAGDCVALVSCEVGECEAPGPSFDLADTNLRACFGPSPGGTDGTIPCPDPAGDPACASTNYCGQDAQYGWDAANPASARFAISDAVASEPVVTDNVTGLVWQQCSAGQSGAECEGEAALQSWFDAVAYCDEANWGGFADWELPDSFELQSIVDYGTTSPAIDLATFANTPSHFAADYDQWWIECVWSSSDYARDSSVAWVLMSNSGDISEGSGTTYHLNDKAADGWDGCYARCVRASRPRQWQRYIRVEPIAGEPVVADTASRLVWQGCSAGQSGSACSQEASMLDWQSSLAYCEGLRWSGYDDWRLPNVKELRSIVYTASESPAIDSTAFPNTPYYGPVTTENIGQYWSATARSYNSFALYVDFGTGFSHFYEQPELRHVRCVRNP